MQIILLILMLFVVKSFLNTSEVDSFDRWKQQASTIASLQEYYQLQSVSNCRKDPSPCSTGLLTGPSYPNKPDAISNEWNYGVNFQSAYDSTKKMVVTVFYPPQYGQGGLADPQALFGWVSSQLINDTSGSIYAGYWDANTQTISGGVSASYGGINSNPKVSVPQGYGGLTLQNHQPIIATVIQ